MNKFLRSAMLFNLYGMYIFAQPHYPVDVSYLVADFKYSQEHGLKICEVQHGALSAVAGDLYLAGGDGSIAPQVADFFTSFPIKKWAAGLLYLPLQRSLVAKSWRIMPSFKTLIQDAAFLQQAACCPAHPSSMASYTGMVYADFDVVGNADAYRAAYPGIVFINAATLPYWNDKYKMNELFDCHAELTTYKADWRLYPKKYDALLAARIQHDMPADVYVIKPRKEAVANGVIVVACKDLDDVLRMILEPAPSLQEHPDKKVAYWLNNKDDTFLIEKYYASDYVACYAPLDSFRKPGTKEIAVRPEELDRASRRVYHYDATMRLAFILSYNEGQMAYHCLGGFWKLPFKAIEQEGTLNEKSISYCKPPFYKAIDHVLLTEVKVPMERAMLLLYEIMLKRNQKST